MKKIIFSLGCIVFSSLSYAEMITVNGEGAAAVNKKDLSITRYESFNSAKKDAVIALINKINGVNSSSNPQINQLLDEITKQVGDQFVVSQSSFVNSDKQLVTKLTIGIDDLTIRQILDDMGIAKKSSRSAPILIVMDEFFTVPTDNQKPLKEVTEFFSDQSYSYDENASYDMKINAKSKSASANSASGRSSATSAAFVADGWGGAAAAASRQSSGYKQKNSQSESASLKASESANYGVSERQNDVQMYRKYVEYQPRVLTPDRQNSTLDGVLREAVRYELRVMDSKLFRSQYLKGKTMSIQQLTNDNELARFADAARDYKADYLMVGSSYIYDRGFAKANGVYECDGVLALKAYSTLDGQVLASETTNTSANAQTADACRAEIASKLATLSMSKIGSQILTSSRNRSMFGNEYTIFVKSSFGGVAANLADELYDALENIEGVSDVDIRRSSTDQHELTLKYKNNKPFSVSLMQSLRKYSSTLASANRSQDGNAIVLCLNGQNCK